MDRLWIFLVPLGLLALAEAVWPRRARTGFDLQRWAGASVLLVLGVLLSRLIVPAGLAGLALWAQGSGVGLLNWVTLPVWAAFAGSLVLLDLSVWGQHVAMHHWDGLWRLHRVHHADPGFDVTTALRFHPGEILVSLAWKGAVVVALGVPVEAALVFEILLNLGAMFSHSNLNLPVWLDRGLRYVMVTPDMHRVHHSVEHVEANRNFGFFLPWWDHLFGLYQSQPKAGHEAMLIGQTDWRGREEQAVRALLLQPLAAGPVAPD